MKKPGPFRYHAFEAAYRRNIGELLVEMERIVRRSPEKARIGSRLRVKVLQLDEQVKALETFEEHSRTPGAQEPCVRGRVLPFPNRSTPAA